MTTFCVVLNKGMHGIIVCAPTAKSSTVPPVCLSVMVHRIPTLQDSSRGSIRPGPPPTANKRYNHHWEQNNFHRLFYKSVTSNFCPASRNKLPRARFSTIFGLGTSMTGRVNIFQPGVMGCVPLAPALIAIHSPKMKYRFLAASFEYTRGALRTLTGRSIPGEDTDKEAATTVPGAHQSLSGPHIHVTHTTRRISKYDLCKTIMRFRKYPFLPPECSLS